MVPVFIASSRRQATPTSDRISTRWLTPDYSDSKSGKIQLITIKTIEKKDTVVIAKIGAVDSQVWTLFCSAIISQSPSIGYCSSVISLIISLIISQQHCNSTRLLSARSNEPSEEKSESRPLSPSALPKAVL